jgi:hypothetical protein
VIVYQCILILKFLAVFGFVGGAVASFLSEDPRTRKRAVHHVASPSLLVVWLAGYGLLMLAGIRWFELWIVASIALSIGANAALAYSAARGHRGGLAILAVAGPIVGIVALMVLKTTWAQVLP